MNTQVIIGFLLSVFFVFSIHADEIKEESEINKPFSEVVVKLIQGKELIQKLDLEIIEEKDKTYCILFKEQNVSLISESKIKTFFIGEEVWSRSVCTWKPNSSFCISHEMKKCKINILFEKIEGDKTKATFAIDIKQDSKSGIQRVIVKSVAKTKLDSIKAKFLEYLEESY